MYKEKYLAAFIENLNNYQLIYTFPYLELYQDWFSEKTVNLIDEINESLLLFTKDMHSDYLRMVKTKLETNNIFNKKPSEFIQKWVTKYGLEGLKFPFRENKDIMEMLTISVKQEKEYARKKDIANIQMDFFCYSASKEYRKALDYIDSLLNIETNPKWRQTAFTSIQLPEKSNVEGSLITADEVPEIKQKQLSEKWYALHYLLEQKSFGQKPPVTREGAFNKAKIESIGKKRSGKKGQSFYKYVRAHSKDIVDAATIKRVFGTEWKQNVIYLSKNDATFTKFLETNY